MSDAQVVLPLDGEQRCRYGINKNWRNVPGKFREVPNSLEFRARAQE